MGVTKTGMFEFSSSLIYCLFLIVCLNFSLNFSFSVTKEGSGSTPKVGQSITVHCTGYLENGMKKFWSTKDAGQSEFTFTVGVGQVVKGWDEGFLSMKIGEQARLTMTGDYAYGPKGFPAWGIPGDATLVFDVEILKIQ